MRRLTITTLFVVLLVAPAVHAENKRRPVLLDTDIGNYLDDAVALAMLLSSPDIDLKAITTSGGDCEDRAWIVCRLLTMVGREKIPVAWGRDPQPKNDVQEMFQYRYHPAVLFNRTAKPLADKDAAQLLYEKLKEQPKGETILLAIGPLTNVARLLEKHPDSKEMVRRIVIMGGAIADRKEPEWNIAQDIKSAQAVFSSGAPLTMVPLDSTESFKFNKRLREPLFKANTLLTQQLETLYQLSNDDEPGLYDAVAAFIAPGESDKLDPSRAFFDGAKELFVTVDDRGFTRSSGLEPNVRVIMGLRDSYAVQFGQELVRVGRFGEPAKPRPLSNFSKLVDRGGLPARVHAFEDFETDIERRWWLTGCLLTKDAPNGQRAMQSVLTLDFDDLQGDLKTMYSAVVFNPVPGPPMGPRTRLTFRYKLQGTDQLRVQLYSLSNGYHRYLALKDLPQDQWQEATVDMTDMRRPDGSGGPLAEDERIDDIQFYVAPTAQVSVDDIVLYDAADKDEKQPFPKRLIFTGWFDTGKQGKEWPGDYEIVEHEKPRKWKAARSVPMKSDPNKQWLRVSFRGHRPVGPATMVRFKAHLTGGDHFTVKIRNDSAQQYRELPVERVEPSKWEEQNVRLDTGDLYRDAGVLISPPRSPDIAGMRTASELLFLLPKGAELMIDDLLVYEPGGE